MRALLLAFLLPGLAAAEGLPPLEDEGFAVKLRASWVPAVVDAGPVDPAYQMVVENLKGTEVPKSFIDAAFTDPAVAVDTKVVELINRPTESLTWEEYRKLVLTEARIAAGVKFVQERADLLKAVSERTGVDPFVYTAIVGVETTYGRNRGSYKVFNSLYTIANRVPRRSQWAGRELAALLRLCLREKAPPMSVVGSYAGAFGFGQFMPSSFLSYAVDFDSDGRSDPYAWPDVLASVANYLVKNGYKPGETDFSSKGSAYKAVFAYNHSDNYVRVVLELRAEILKRVSQA
ncbi:MAG TPA: hypothetical protein DCM05_07190 [Elusimicrobia bacterium]|nr:hypothetical protein [Elusimicrobiota bacterium]